LVCAIAVTTISALSLAIFNLRAMSFLFISRASVFSLAAITVLSDPPILVQIAIISTLLLQLGYFSEKLISKSARKIGATNEDMFTLKTPLSITLWFVFTWGIVWAILIESIHLFGTNKSVLGVVAVIFAILMSAFFLPSQLRALYRRCVIVPHGIVASDPITLTDVVLLPLAKIQSIDLVDKLDSSIPIGDNTFAGISSKTNIVSINLSEKTDSLIVRNGINETERKNVDKLLLSLSDPKTFVSLFHSRFHKVSPENLSKSQEKMIEKELGIQTAPRSDSPLPAWRTKKPEA